jgi:hypothetical protein
MLKDEIENKFNKKRKINKLWIPNVNQPSIDYWKIKLKYKTIKKTQKTTQVNWG